MELVTVSSGWATTPFDTFYNRHNGGHDLQRIVDTHGRMPGFKNWKKGKFQEERMGN